MRLRNSPEGLKSPAAPRRPRSVLRKVLVVGAVAVAPFHPVEVAAQAPTKLPAIVVQGATLEVAPVKPVPVPQAVPQPAATPQPAAAPAQTPAPQPSPSAPPAASGQATSGQAASGQAAGGQAASGQAAGGGGAGTAAPGPVTAGQGGTATGGTATGGTATGINISEIGTSVSVVTGAQLRARQISHAADALRALPGVSVTRTGGATGLTAIRLRGGEANHTLVLIDGVVANDSSDGAFDFGGLLADDIERIEVIRGPMSGLYGSNALGGVVNIVTRSGKGPARVTLKGETGSFGTWSGGIALSGGNETAHGLIAYHARRTNGFNIAPIGPEEDGSRLENFVAKGGFRPFEVLKIDLQARNMKNHGETDRDGGPAGTLSTAVDAADTFSSDVWLTSANARLDMFDGHLTHNLFVNRRTTDRDNISELFGFSFNDSKALTYGFAATLRFEAPLIVATRHALTVKVQDESESFETSGGFGSPGANEERGRVAYAGEYRGTFADQLFLTATARRDDNDNFKDYSTWRLSASWKIEPLGLSPPALRPFGLSPFGLSPFGLRPHSSVGTAVKLPTMFQQFGFIPAFFSPNPNLSPEESFGWDAGLEVTLKSAGLVVDVTYFNQDLTNKIDIVGFPSTPINLPGTSTREGIEIEARWSLSPELSLSAAYTYLDAKDADGRREVRRSPHSGRIDLDYSFGEGRGHVNLSAKYTGPTPEDAFLLPFFTPTRVTLHDYWLVNAAASYKLRPDVEVFGRVENLLDQHYQEVYGFETAGIAAYAGVKLNFTAEDAGE